MTTYMRDRRGSHPDARNKLSDQAIVRMLLSAECGRFISENARQWRISR